MSVVSAVSLRIAHAMAGSASLGQGVGVDSLALPSALEHHCAYAYTLTCDEEEPTA